MDTLQERLRYKGKKQAQTVQKAHICSFVKFQLYIYIYIVIKLVKAIPAQFMSRVWEGRISVSKVKPTIRKKTYIDKLRIGLCKVTWTGKNHIHSTVPVWASWGKWNVRAIYHQEALILKDPMYCVKKRVLRNFVNNASFLMHDVIIHVPYRVDFHQTWFCIVEGNLRNTSEIYTRWNNRFDVNVCPGTKKGQD